MIWLSITYIWPDIVCWLAIIWRPEDIAWFNCAWVLTTCSCLLAQWFTKLIDYEHLWCKTKAFEWCCCFDKVSLNLNSLQNLNWTDINSLSRLSLVNREEKESSKFCIDKLVLSLVSHTNKVREPNAFELFLIKYRNTLNLTEVRILCLGLLSLAGAFISGYRSMERLGVFFAPPCESIARFYPMLNSAVSIYTPGPSCSKAG